MLLKHKILLLLLLLLTLAQRLIEIGENKPGKDTPTHIQAITSFSLGINPYIYTVESYDNKEDVANHGYSYLPGFLYSLGGLYYLAPSAGVEFYTLWKIFVLLFDLGVVTALFLYLLPKNQIVALIAPLFWIFNPYLVFTTSNYTLLDPVPVFLYLIALICLEKNNLLSAVFLSLSIIFKPFSLIFLPMFLIITKRRRLFLVIYSAVFIAFSLPFMTDINNFLTYINGSLLVHGDRVLQGRPVLFYISYYYKVEFFQVLPLKFYAFMSSFFCWILTPILYYVFKVRRVFLLASVIAVNFLVFTPVLNRTYLLWFIPIFLIATFKYSDNKHCSAFLVANIAYWLFCSWYLIQWKDGFHVSRPW